jgi:hypothetical protein
MELDAKFSNDKRIEGFDDEQSYNSFALLRDLSEPKEKERKDQKYSYLIL